MAVQISLPPPHMQHQSHASAKQKLRLTRWFCGGRIGKRDRLTGRFHQLSNSKVEARFADERTYVYKGEVIDRAFHLGYDLAVTRNYPVEAA